MGAKELLAVVNELPEQVRVEVLVPIVRAGGKVVKEGAKFLAPVDEGDLRDSIDQKEVRYPASFSAISVVGPARGRRKGGKMPSKYAHLVEFGHQNRDGTFTPPKPFMRPAVMTAETYAAQPMFAAAEKAFDQVTSKLVRKYGHKTTA